MKFEIEFYTNTTGASPIDDFLDDLRRRQPILHKLMLAGLRKMENRENHGEPLTRPVGDDLYEVRVGDKNIARVIWFFMSGRRIVAAHDFVKKSQKLKRHDLELALERKADYEKRRAETEKMEERGSRCYLEL